MRTQYCSCFLSSWCVRRPWQCLKVHFADEASAFTSALIYMCTPSDFLHIYTKLFPSRDLLCPHIHMDICVLRI